MANGTPDIRQVIFEVFEEFQKRGPASFQSASILRQVGHRLNLRTDAEQQTLLTVWNDLVRAGVIAPGFNLDNPTFPHMHLTAAGRQMMTQWRRDPYNPDGYMAVVRPHLANHPVALSYIVEAVNAFQSGCLKAAAVLVGGAAESLVLDVRDAMVNRLTAVSNAVPAKIKDWKVKTVRDAIEAEVDSRKSQMDHPLYERFSAFWVPVSDHMRLSRNEVGHPVSVDPVTHDIVHGSLLLFPEFARLVVDLKRWIPGMQ